MSGGVYGRLVICLLWHYACFSWFVFVFPELFVFFCYLFCIFFWHGLLRLYWFWIVLAGAGWCLTDLDDFVRSGGYALFFGL